MAKCMVYTPKKQEILNWSKFKVNLNLKILSLYMCLAGTMIASWSLMQEVAGSSPFTVMANIFVTEFAEFIESI